MKEAKKEETKGEKDAVKAEPVRAECREEWHVRRPGWMLERLCRPISLTIATRE